MPSINCALLLDFGASRIKAALFLDDRIIECSELPAPLPCVSDHKRFEINPDSYISYIEYFLSLFNKYPIQCIFICSEMHGFIILDSNNNPISNYISWKDERCNISSFYNLVCDHLEFNKFVDDYYCATGMKPRSCYPYFKLFSILKDNKIKYAKIASLPCYICSINNSSENKIHTTMMAGLGFYNIYNHEIDNNLISYYNNYVISFNRPTNIIEIGGYVKFKNSIIPIYTGVGDHQCAVYGADNTSSSISVNIGTGAQVAAIMQPTNNFEQRPYFEDKYLSVITHIPAGRALSSFEKFFLSINSNFKFWDIICNTNYSVPEDMLDISFSVFESSWNFNNFASISNINETNFILDNFITSLLYNFSSQFYTAVNTIDPKNDFSTIILSGGLSHKIRYIYEYFCRNSNYNVILRKNKIDETLLGLKKIAESTYI